MPHGRGYGCIRDAEDKRDYKFAAPVPSFVVPNAHDLTPMFPPVMDQGPYGTCTAHGAIEAMRYIMRNTDQSDVELSRAQLYWDAGVIEGDTSDVGRQIRDVVKALATKGVAREELWGYDKLGQMPTLEVYADAANQVALEYVRVEVDRAAINTAIYMGNPVIIGIDVFKGFEADEAAQTGIIPMPGAFETPTGAHCVLLGAYDPQWDTFMNSWADWWGLPDKKGYGKLPRGYLEKHGSDLWTIFMRTQGATNV